MIYPAAMHSARIFLKFILHSTFLYLIHICFTGQPIAVKMHYLIQIAAGFIVSFIVGMTWYSPMLFGKLWWQLQFPGKPFGKLNMRYSPYPFTMISVIAHSSLITFMVNTFNLEIAKAMLFVSVFLLFHLAVSVPHYVFPGFPLLLLVMNTAYDVSQSLAATVVIVLLK